MIYIYDTQLPNKSFLVNALTNIYGINLSTAKYLCSYLGLANTFTVNELTDEQLKNLIKLIEVSNLKINTDLKNINLNIKKKLLQIKSYRGLRRSMKLPVRGQRTHTNARTCKK